MLWRKVPWNGLKSEKKSSWYCVWKHKNTPVKSVFHLSDVKKKEREFLVLLLLVILDLPDTQLANRYKQLYTSEKWTNIL